MCDGCAHSDDGKPQGKGKTMFDVKRYTEYMMTEGDAIEYAKLQGDVSALQRCLSKQPWAGKMLRHKLTATVKRIAAIEARYS